MAFYTDLCDVYDVLFPVSDAQRALFEKIRGLGEIRRVTDAGCGSGAQLLHFASEGISCAGFDPDPALVALAREKLSPYPNARVEAGGFADTIRLALSDTDLLLCLGNSLVHVPREEAARFLVDAVSVMAPGGWLLLQVLNYERLFREGTTELPLMRSDDGMVEFRRRYAWEGREKVRFHTTLRLASGDGPRIVRNDIPLHPLYPDEIWDMISEAGFDPIRYYGDFAYSGFTPESEALVCLARKP
ncbi:MAG: class I SAM-dependent methyltransferase [Deltaproteobacteria bacterium]|nr:class I SAM-dependent methyltransferase [Deltaproteobacteria bacterium]